MMRNNLPEDEGGKKKKHKTTKTLLADQAKAEHTLSSPATS